MFGAFFYSYCPVFIITSHLLFLKAHFLVKPNASLLGKICSPAWRRITTWPCLGIPKKSIAGLAIFSLKKINIWAGYLCWARRATARPVNTLLSSEQQRKHRQEKLSVLMPQKHKYCSSCLVPAGGRFLCNSLVYWLLHRLTMVWDRDVRKAGGSKKNIVVYIISRNLRTYGYGPSGWYVSNVSIIFYCSMLLYYLF